jgi:hypothetical protein
MKIITKELFYTGCEMKRSAWMFGFVLLFTTAFCLAEASPYVPGKILDVQQKTRSEVLYYLVNTPVTKDDPYFEVSIESNGTVYETEFVPRHIADALPEDWTIGSKVSLRAEKHYLYLKRQDGREVQMMIVHKAAVTPQNQAPEKQ